MRSREEKSLFQLDSLREWPEKIQEAGYKLLEWLATMNSTPGNIKNLQHYCPLLRQALGATLISQFSPALNDLIWKDRSAFIAAEVEENDPEIVKFYKNLILALQNTEQLACLIAINYETPHLLKPLIFSWSLWQGGALATHCKLWGNFAGILKCPNGKGFYDLVSDLIPTVSGHYAELAGKFKEFYQFVIGGLGQQFEYFSRPAVPEDPARAYQLPPPAAVELQNTEPARYLLDPIRATINIFAKILPETGLNEAERSLEKGYYNIKPGASAFNRTLLSLANIAITINSVQQYDFENSKLSSYFKLKGKGEKAFADFWNIHYLNEIAADVHRELMKELKKHLDKLKEYLPACREVAKEITKYELANHLAPGCLLRPLSQCFSLAENFFLDHGLYVMNPFQGQGALPYLEQIVEEAKQEEKSQQDRVRFLRLQGGRSCSIAAGLDKYLAQIQGKQNEPATPAMQKELIDRLYKKIVLLQQGLQKEEHSAVFGAVLPLLAAGPRKGPLSAGELQALNKAQAVARKIELDSQHELQTQKLEQQLNMAQLRTRELQDRVASARAEAARDEIRPAIHVLEQHNFLLILNAVKKADLPFQTIPADLKPDSAEYWQAWRGAVNSIEDNHNLNGDKKNRLAVLLAVAKKQTLEVYLREAHQHANLLARQPPVLMETLLTLFDQARTPADKLACREQLIQLMTTDFISPRLTELGFWANPQEMSRFYLAINYQAEEAETAARRKSRLIDLLTQYDSDDFIKLVQEAKDSEQGGIRKLAAFKCILRLQAIPESLQEAITQESYVSYADNETVLKDLVAAYQDQAADADIKQQIGKFILKLAHQQDVYARLIFDPAKDYLKILQTSWLESDKTRYYEAMVRAMNFSTGSPLYANWVKNNSAVIAAIQAIVFPGGPTPDFNDKANLWLLCQLLEKFIKAHLSPGSRAEKTMGGFFMSLVLCEDAQEARQKMMTEYVSSRGHSAAKYIEMVTQREEKPALKGGATPADQFWLAVKADLLGDIEKYQQELRAEKRHFKESATKAANADRIQFCKDEIDFIGTLQDELEVAFLALKKREKISLYCNLVKETLDGLIQRRQEHNKDAGQERQDILATPLPSGKRLSIATFIQREESKSPVSGLSNTSSRSSQFSASTSNLRSTSPSSGSTSPAQAEEEAPALPDNRSGSPAPTTSRGGFFRAIAKIATPKAKSDKKFHPAKTKTPK